MKKFFYKNWYIAACITAGSVLGGLLSNLLLNPSITNFLGVLGWILIIALSLLLRLKQLSIEYKVLQGKKEIADSYVHLIEHINDSLRYYNGYDEKLVESVAVYSRMRNNGVEAPIANSLVSFSQEIGTNNTIFLINVDHDSSKWSLRVAGTPIYLNQLKVIWDLVHKYLEGTAKTEGALVLKSSSILN